MNKPPFIVDQEKRVGLSYDLIDYLNHFSSQYNYHLVYLPKQRALDQVVNKGALLWINPLWVGDERRKNYDWIEGLFFDKELYISNDPSLHYREPASFYGKILVGVRGYNYIDLEASFRQKKIIRIDLHKEVLIPAMLIKNRADIGVIGYQTYFYLQKEMPEISAKLSIIDGYNFEFSRGILFSKSQPSIKKDFENWFNSVEGKANWSLLKEKWLIHE